MRPNYAQDPPPAAITVGGSAYKVDTNFLTWIHVTKLLRDFIPHPETPEQAQHNVDLMCEIQTAVFGGVLEDEDPGETLRAIIEFSSGYPNAPVMPEPSREAPACSFEYDLNYIILAIRNQSGIDLSYHRDHKNNPFHWWEFLLEFSSLCGDHYILRLTEIRSYKKDPEKPEHQRARFALPRENTAADQAALDEINNEFYNA